MDPWKIAGLIIFALIAPWLIFQPRFWIIAFWLSSIAAGVASLIALMNLQILGALCFAVVCVILSCVTGSIREFWDSE